MRQGEGVTSVHFPRAEKGNNAASKKPAANALEVFANAHRDVETIREKLRGLLTSDSRHGDLQAVLSATLRLAEHVKTLIEFEEQ